MTTEGWMAVEITMSPDVASDDAVLDILSSTVVEIGAQGLEVFDDNRPIKVVAAFPPEAASSVLANTVRDALVEANIPVGAISARSYAPIDWATHWKRHFQPLDFGKIWIIPSWLDAPPQAGHVLWIDPSMAFGTGLHSTTSLCLERVVELSPVGTMLDVGTGTGILSFAALKLGAQRAVGIDNDPDALLVAEENAKYNGLDRAIELSGEPPKDEQFDLVVANILPDPLIALAPTITNAVKDDGLILLSGLLFEQIDWVSGVYEDLGLRRQAVAQREEWARVELVKR